MNRLDLVEQVSFRLPPRGILEANGPDDPLPYYYHPLAGFLYCRRIQKALSMLTPPYESILEIGYGSGILLPTLASIGTHVTAIDIESEPERIKVNLGKIGVSAKLIRGDILHTDFPNDSFDLIVAISIFEHIREPKPVLKEIFRILRPGGKFLVGMPRVDFLMEKLFPLIGYHNIKALHVTDYRKFLKTACQCFKLIKYSKMPSFVPSFAALYFNMLFLKL